jgi:HSP20 family protein
MAIVWFKPYRDIDIMQRQMNRLFNEMMSYGSGESEIESSEGMSFVPAAKLHETPESIAPRMEVPGIEPQDLGVKVTAEAMAIQGERKSGIKHNDRPPA